MNDIRFEITEKYARTLNRKRYYEMHSRTRYLTRVLLSDGRFNKVDAPILNAACRGSGFTRVGAT